MHSYQYITQYPERTISILGMTLEQFNDLAQRAIEQASEQQAEQEKEKQRVNKKGAGRPKSLSSIEEICLTLFYLRQTAIFEVLGMQFDISNTTANDRFHDWLKILRELLPASLLEAAEKRLSTPQAQADLETQELLVDSFEQGRFRPLDNQEQTQYFSGKKANHTLKTQVISLPNGADIVDVLTAERGPEADINLMRKRLTQFREGQRFLGDKAYIGEGQILTPKKKPKGGRLTSEEKANNRILSQRRIDIEHLIRRVKIFRVVQERFRLRVAAYPIAILTVCGLTRLRMGTLKLA